INEHSVYIGGGAVYSGLGGRENVLGLAIAHARFNAGLVSETAIELSYKAQLFSNVSIQPDVQYIIKPYGVDSNTPNALVGILRFTVEL
ncbi:MAG TPA: carbohydrate porin, partial [Bacteroidales bacterium]|nr:carbohydrate porin [Bacteroidales bacterium]